MIENVLASRYACGEISDVFDRKHRYLLERDFWISLLKLQVKNGLNVANEAIHAYESVKNNIDMNSIKNRELNLKHDVKARIEEFNELAGFEYIHIGLTSRDLTENIELFQIRTGLLHIRLKSLLVLKILGEKINKYKTSEYIARTHNVPAQISTIGKRFSVVAEEFMSAISKLEFEISNLKFRGLKGAIGSSSDLSIFFTEKQIQEIEINLAKKYGFENVMSSVGQVYPRSYDFSFISTLVQLASAIENFAISFRLMAGHGFVSESFTKSQVGSSAMPHKKNARTAERISGLSAVLKGYCNMAMSTAGNQWNEGDVSCSVVRRIYIPDSFLAIDGILNSALSLLQGMLIDEQALSAEVEKEIPSLFSSRLLMEAVKKGIGRELAHSTIKEIVLKHRGNLESFKNEIINCATLSINLSELDQILNSKSELLGLVSRQVEEISKKIRILTSEVDSSLEIPELI